MAPKIKVTREMIIDAAADIARESGHEHINARSIAEKLHCSTQPVMYQFASMEELKRAAYDKADQIHTEYLLNVPEDRDPVLSIGLNYIRFAVEETHLFRFLFQSGYVREKDLPAMIEAEELMPVLSAMQEETGMDMKDLKEVFLLIAMFAHGYASILANNPLVYDEELAAGYLQKAFTGAVYALREKDNEEAV